MSKTEVTISVKSISKSYVKNRVVQNSLRDEIMNFWSFGKKPKEEYFLALDSVSFEVKQAEVLGVIGSNGAGKSTLLKVLSDITVPDSGEARIHGRVSSLLEVGTGFHRELSGRENIYLNGLILGMSRAEIKALEEEIIEFSGVENYIDTPIKHYSSGMGVRLAFSVAAHLNADILLIDEVLAVGDAAFQEKCLAKVKNIADSGRTTLFVSHQLNVIQQLCTRCIMLQDGKIIADGNPRETISLYLENLSVSNVFEPKHGPIKKVKIVQEGQMLKLSASYQVKQKVKIPSLGFTIYDTLGNSITGSNPIIVGINIDKKEYPRNGEIEVEISQPKLRDGNYFISIWFGIDGFSDLVKHDKCLSIRIIGMADLHYKTNITGNGSVYCECKFNFF